MRFHRAFATLFVGVVVSTAFLTTSAVGSTSSREFIDQRCAPVSGLCWSTAYEGDTVSMVMESDEHGGRYTLCVRSPRGDEACRPIRLHRRPRGPRGYGGYRSRAIFSKSFKFDGAGLYRVVWRGYPLEDPISPTLFFRLGSNGKPLRN